MYLVSVGVSSENGGSFMVISFGRSVAEYGGKNPKMNPCMFRFMLSKSERQFVFCLLDKPLQK